MRKLLGNIVVWICGMIILCIIQGCKIRIVPEEEAKKEVEFVIVSEECIPSEVLELIESKKHNKMKFTYVDKDERYIIIGYGEQKTGGYSIYIEDFYATENALYVDTCLMGPNTQTEKKNIPSYPVIVLQTSELGLPVVFK